MLYENLFTLEDVNAVPEGTNYLDYLNPCLLYTSPALLRPHKLA